MLPVVIACGDPAGIGPEVTVKAVSLELQSDPGPESQPGFVLVGDRHSLEEWLQHLGGLPRWDMDPGGGSARVRIVDPNGHSVPWKHGHGSPATAQAALNFLQLAAEGCLRGEFSALVTAPVSKETILRAGIPFVGQTEFLAQVCGSPEVTMMLLGDDAAGRWLRVALATTHLPLRRVAEELTTIGVHRAIRQSAEACRLLGLQRARVAVCGLNPHAGEGGMLGDEEARVIVPAIRQAQSAGIDVRGPSPADTVFGEALRGDFDAVVAMYHDQGLAPLKLAVWERGVNWTLGLPFPRTSPDHGTAFDIAGRGIANPSSMRAAIQLAVRLARQRPALLTDAASSASVHPQSRQPGRVGNGPRAPGCVPPSAP